MAGETMKREAITHTKMKRLCRRLDVPLYVAIGLLESMWHLTARETPRGDIGKISNEDIAQAIDYRGDEEQLIDVLVACGWLDIDSTARLAVHDWHEHADDAVQRRLARAGLRFVGGHMPKLNRLSASERKAALEIYGRPAGAQTPEVGAQGHDVGAPPEPSPSPEPCQSPARPEPGAREGSLTDRKPVRSEEVETPFPVSGDDDEKPRTYATPEVELKEIYREKTGEAITIAVLEAIRISLGDKGVSMAEFVAEVRKHFPNDWKNPPGFLRNLAKTFRSKTRKASTAPAKETVVQPENKCDVCGSDRGAGLLPPGHKANPSDRVIACPCASPEFVIRMQGKGYLPKTAGLGIVKERAAS